MAQVSMQSYINGLMAYQNSGVRQMSQISGFSKGQNQARELLQSYEDTRGRLNTLSGESIGFMREYTTRMGRMGVEAGRLSGSGATNLVNDRQGNTTPQRIENTVVATRNMVQAYNDNLKLARENANRGMGVQQQLSRMAEAPADEETMAKAGITRNEDGSLSLDESRLTQALGSADAPERREIAGAIGRVAEGIRADAQSGLRTPSQRLISNDIRQMGNRQTEAEDPIRDYYQSLRGSGAYGLNNMAATGMLMNMMV